MLASSYRCLAVWSAATAAAVALGALLVPALVSPAAGFDGLLVRTSALVATLATGWLWTVTTVVVVEARRGRTRFPVPAAVRRALLTACGVAVVAGLAAPAGAAPRGDGPVTAVAVVADALAGLPLPDRPHGRPAPHRPAPHRPPTAAATVAPAPGPAVTVRPGDTLWSLAAEHLGHGDCWPEIYALNRAVVGADPDLIRPAQRLHLPAKENR